MSATEQDTKMGRKRNRTRQQTHARRTRAAGAALLAMGLAFSIAPPVLAAIVVPELSEAVFIQTTGPLQVISYGDYVTNDAIDVGVGPGIDPAGAGDNRPHRLELIIPCEPGLVFTVELFDPAVDAGGAVPDEMFGPRNNRTADEQWFDNTIFWLYAPDGSLLQETVYEPGTSPNAWTTFATISTPASPQRGASCGSYMLETVTGARDPYEIGTYNDDNAWQLRLNGVGFEAELGPDGLPGTGDQAQIGLRDVSYLQRATACQDFYWFAEHGETDMYMLNFDMDRPEEYGAGSVCYFPPGVSGDCSGGYPGAPVIQGTRSGNASWNNAASFDEQSYRRPTYPDMRVFDMAGDFEGDAVAQPEPGLWRAQLCVDAGNQYMFEVAGHRTFLEPPLLPDLVVEKDDGVETVDSPGETTYTILLANRGSAAAVALPGDEPEVVDPLPAGMSFVSCQVNAPLIGTCGESPAGSGHVLFQLTGHTGYNSHIILPGGQNGAQSRATLSVTASVAAGLADGTLLENVVTLDYSDAYQGDYEPLSDNDVDRVVAGQAPPTPTPPAEPGEPTAAPPTPPAAPPSAPGAAVAGAALQKFVSPENAVVGETVTWTVVASNPTGAAVSGVTVTDTLPAMFGLVRVTPSRGTATLNGSRFSVSLGDLQPGEEVVISVETVANSLAAPPQTCNTAFIGSTASNEVCVTIFPAELPATGGAPPGEALALSIGGALLLVAGVALLWRGRRQPQA